MTEVRPPAVAGQFYRRDPAALEDQLAACFLDEHGPGSIPGSASEQAGDRAPGGRELVGLVAPHAGYPYSGPVAAHAYAALARTPPPETAVVLGPNHRRVGATMAVDPHDAWETPLGTVPVDDALRSAILDRAESLRRDDRAHREEHAIEVQLPFLQYRDATPQIVPIAVATRDRDACEALGEAIAAGIENAGRDAVVIASTDLTHYEPPEAAAAADEPVLELLAERDPDGVLDHVERTGHTMCGPGATAATLTATNALGAERGVVYAYATSGETADTGARTVGYPAVGLERP